MARSYWHSSHYLEWLLDRQDVIVHRISDLKALGSEEEYQKVMIFFTDVIQAFGKSIELRQQVIATAIVYFKRFYSRNPFKAIDPWLMAPSCLFLASKVEEFGVVSQKNLMASCRNVVHSHYLAYFPESGYGYPYRAQDVLECEFILLEAMDCSLIIFHPYRPLVQFCDELRPQLHEFTDLVLERAWWIVNDSYRTDVSLHYPPFIIALACLQLAIVLIVNSNPNLLDNSNSGSTVSSTSASATTASALTNLFGVNGATVGSASNHNLLSTANTTNNISGSNTCSKHTGYLNAQSYQTNVNLLLVADQWFSKLNVDMEKVFEVTRHILSLYDLWRRFDEPNEMPNLLLKRIPRPVVQSTHSSQNYGSSNAVNVTNCCTTNQSSIVLSTSGTQQSHTGTVTAVTSMLVTTSGSAVATGNGVCASTVGSIQNIADPILQQQRNVATNKQSRLHTHRDWL